MKNEQLSIFQKQFSQAVADRHISTFGDAAKFGLDWMYNSMSAENAELRAENAALREENERLLTAVKAVERIASRGDVNVQPLLAPILITVKTVQGK